MTRFTIRMSSIHRETDFISIFACSNVRGALALVESILKRSSVNVDVLLLLLIFIILGWRRYSE